MPMNNFSRKDEHLVGKPRIFRSEKEMREAVPRDDSESGIMSADDIVPEPAVAKDETNAVSRLKLIVLTVILVVTVGASLGVYFYTSFTEYDEFESAFRVESFKAADSIGAALDVSLEATDSFIADLVSYSRYSNSTWPLVTLPDYAVRVAKLQRLSRAALVSQYHLVTDAQRDSWERYTRDHNGWVDESINIQETDDSFQGKIVRDYDTIDSIHNENGLPTANKSVYFPKWQHSPVVPIDPPYNLDATGYPSFDEALPTLMEEHEAVLGSVSNIPDDPDDRISVQDAIENTGRLTNYLGDDDDPSEPFTELFYPILSNMVDSVSVLKGTGDLVGILSIGFFWKEMLKDIPTPLNDGLVIVFGNYCRGNFTYQINGAALDFLGVGDLHEYEYEHLIETTRLIDMLDSTSADKFFTGLPLSDGPCSYRLDMYPSREMQRNFTSSNPALYTAVAVVIIALTVFVFLLYDCMQETRQEEVYTTAVHSSEIVSSLFPSTVRDRLFPKPNTQVRASKLRLKKFLREGKWSADSSFTIEEKISRPIADLFLQATVLIADISGFTAWSSEREPSQVFTLLETVYGTFDTIARRCGVFKVETIGDTYVAVVGLPENCEQHAVVMSKFACACRDKMTESTKHLELTLGPDTGDLQCRFGMHSGPVTAGVLRGEKARFQLFGDTVNTAARMETTGVTGLIHASQATAQLLIESGKSHWIEARDELIEAKGKGKMQTYWIEPQLSTRKSVLCGDVASEIDQKTHRLVGWTTDVLAGLIRHIIARHRAKKYLRFIPRTSCKDQQPTPPPEERRGKTVIDEVKEIIELPEFDPLVAGREDSPDTIQLDPNVVSQLREYVTTIASLYHQNPFHNFEHASHVGMSVAKLMSRIVAPDQVLMQVHVNDNNRKVASSLHDYTYGITSDPLTHFACVFAALIHDVDHQGVPNTQLVKEQSPLAVKYSGKSVAEQNSIDIAWNLFMEPRFQELRSTICSTEAEMKRFRQLVVNSVMATDIMDKDLKNLRNARWDRAFSESALEDSERDRVNRKATIVIEHLIQASDVAHTMQHWHIYRKWNERLFEELYVAFKNGRADKNPAESWYQGEMGFFDFYILPLAKKLSECGVFGVSSDEYLNYAQRNREEWETRGREVVASMVEKCNRLY